METRTLGRTGLRVSELGFGCWAIGGASYGRVDDRESLRALAYAFEQGISFFDTADCYGNGRSEKLLGETFKESSKRLGVIIATKVGLDFYHGGTKRNTDPEYIRFACGESLKRLRTDYIDLYQLHNPKWENKLEEQRAYQALAALKQEGKIRHFGISIHVAREGVEAIQEGSSETIQAIYNMIDQRIRTELMPLCEEHNIGLIAREPLYCGLLTGKYTAESRFPKDDHRNRWSREKYLTDLKKIDRIRTAFESDRIPLKQAAIEFVVFEKAVSVVIPGMKTVANVEDHLRAVRSPVLSAEAIKQIQELYQEEELFQTGFFRN